MAEVEAQGKEDEVVVYEWDSIAEGLFVRQDIFHRQ